MAKIIQHKVVYLNLSSDFSLVLWNKMADVPRIVEEPTNKENPADKVDPIKKVCVQTREKNTYSHVGIRT